MSWPAAVASIAQNKVLWIIIAVAVIAVGVRFRPGFIIFRRIVVVIVNAGTTIQCGDGVMKSRHASGYAACGIHLYKYTSNADA